MTLTQAHLRLCAPILAITVVLGIGACSLPNKTVTEAAAASSEPYSDGEILQVIRTLNDGEIAQARLAMEQAENPAVRDVAQMIVRDHERNNQRVEELVRTLNIELNGSPLNGGLRMQANQIREELADLSGTEFDCTYLRKQAELHELALETVQSRLIPDAEERMVKSHLEDTAKALQQHHRASQQAISRLNCDRG